MAFLNLRKIIDTTYPQGGGKHSGAVRYSLAKMTQIVNPFSEQLTASLPIVTNSSPSLSMTRSGQRHLINTQKATRLWKHPISTVRSLLSVFRPRLSIYFFTYRKYGIHHAWWIPYFVCLMLFFQIFLPGYAFGEIWEPYISR